MRMVAGMSSQVTSIHVKYRVESDVPAGESLWAEPVDATDGGGVFRLCSDLGFTPLRRGDVVRCELDADSILQVVEIVEVVPGLLVGFEHPANSGAEVKRVLEANLALGHQVNRLVDGFAEVFMPGAELDTDVQMARTPASWSMTELLDGPHRLKQAMQDIDFVLNTAPVMNYEPIDYWAPDDETWAALGVGDPAMLAAIQSIAVADPRVLATIEAGRHQDVLTYFERLMVMDPALLPTLDRPLLVDPSAQ